MQTIWEWPYEHQSTSGSQFYLLPSSLNSGSPYTGQSTIYGPQVQRWTAKLTFPNMMPKKWRPLQAFVTRLRGMKGLVRMIDYQRMRPYYDQYVVKPTEENWSDGLPWNDDKGWVSGYLPPYIIADEAAEEGATSLVVRGLPSNLKSALTMGDPFENRPGGIPANHGHFNEIVHDANTNSVGKTRLYFEPGLRRSVAAGDMVVIRNATCVFGLASDSEGVMARGESGEATIGLSLLEALPE